MIAETLSNNRYGSRGSAEIHEMCWPSWAGVPPKLARPNMDDVDPLPAESGQHRPMVKHRPMALVAQIGQIWTKLGRNSDSVASVQQRFGNRWTTSELVGSSGGKLS